MPSTRQETRSFSENATNAVVITTALETAANAVVITDNKGIILWVNPAFTGLTGYPSEEVLGKNPGLLKAGKHDRQFYQNLWTTVLTGKTWRGEIHQPSQRREPLPGRAHDHPRTLQRRSHYPFSSRS